MAGNNLFNPYISYWSGSGTGIRSTADRQPSTALNQSSLVLLIHGYNNDQAEASAAYNNFIAHLNKIININANLVGVYWPGANWEGPLYYMQALGQVEKIAPGFAQDLYQAAQARKYLKIDIVTHSLGGRLAMELIKELLKIKAGDPSLGGLVINRIVMMAGAVPVSYLQDINQMKPALAAFQATASLYSMQDTVLHWAFPAGQTVAGQGFFPVALGRKYWVGGDFSTPKVKQTENRGADHGYYWGAENSENPTEDVAAGAVNDFLTLGSPKVRTMPQRVASVANPMPVRLPPPGRGLPVRTM
jgi:pimeloyl-ACP methyl ester carboxylesterase